MGGKHKDKADVLTKTSAKPFSAVEKKEKRKDGIYKEKKITYCSKPYHEREINK